MEKYKLLIISVFILVMLVSLVSALKTIELDSTLGIYDGHIDSLNARQDGAATFFIGVIAVPSHRGFLEFNTSTIPDSATISDVDLNFTVVINYGAGDTVDITRFNSSQISDTNNYADDATGNRALRNNISTGYDGETGGALGDYITASTVFQSSGGKLLDLSSFADIDLQSQLINDFFAMGLFGSDESFDGATVRSSEATTVSERPRLIVIYDACDYSGVGDWIINETCTITGEIIILASGNSIIIQDDGALVLNGGSNLSFTGNNQAINISKGGGMLNLSKGSGIAD